jgi:hypothetical protein
LSFIAFSFFIFRLDFDGKVRTSVFTKPAGDAFLAPGYGNLFVLIEDEDFFGAEVDADAAPLAPLSPDEMLFQLRFGHFIKTSWGRRPGKAKRRVDAA